MSLIEFSYIFHNQFQVCFNDHIRKVTFQKI
jgi:hypothetical protein